jgi:hypothetical protein
MLFLFPINLILFNEITYIILVRILTSLKAFTDTIDKKKLYF